MVVMAWIALDEAENLENQEKIKDVQNVYLGGNKKIVNRK